MAVALKKIDTQIMDYLHALNLDEKKAVLSVVKTFAKENKHKDFWDELDKEQQSLIDQAIKEADEGKLTPHKDAMKKLRKK